MKGFVLSQEGHVVIALAPVNASGGKTGQAFSMKNHQHASIILAIGAQAAQMTSVVLNACSDVAGDNPTAIAFELFKCESAGQDTLGAKTLETAAGFQPSATAGIFYVIEIDTAELPQGFPYLQLVINNGANADYAAAIAILSGARYGEDLSPTVLV